MNTQRSRSKRPATNRILAFGTVLGLLAASVDGCRRAPDSARQAGDARIAFVSADGDTAMHVDSDDFRWEQARRDARCTLSEFVRRFRNPPPTQSDLALKVALELSPDQFEHVWLRVLSVEADSAFRGTVNNDPSDTTRYHYGDTVRVSARRVSDWYAVDRDTLMGGFTIRYARLSLTKAERAQFDAEHHYVIGNDAANLRRLPNRCVPR